MFPDANIVPVDYDPGASEANQTNRIKLLMTVAKDNLKAEQKEKKVLQKENEKSLEKKEKVEKKYKQIIENIVETAKLKPFAYDLILTNVANYDSKYQSQYLEGLKTFIPEGLTYIHSKYKVNTNNISISKQVLSSVIEEYNRMFSAEISRIEEEKMAQIQSKLIASSILASSILLFIICLFLPLLIKIEENTRQQLELIKKEKENA